MKRGRRHGIVVVADDLSGAAETAAVFGIPSRVQLVSDAYIPDAAPADDVVRVFDLDTRYSRPSVAEAALRAVLRGQDDARTFIKVDSLLRGNVAAVTRAALQVGRGVVFSPALPSAGRTVVNGVPLVGSVPLAATRLWQSEDHAPPASVSSLLSELQVRLVSLAELRSGSLPAILDEARRESAVVAADAESAADLEIVADAAWAGDEPAVLVGSRGLAEAAAALVGLGAASAPHGRAERILVVVGSADVAAHRQFERLSADLEPTTVHHSPSSLLDGSAGRFRIEGALTAVRISPDERIAPQASHELADRFAASVADALDGVDLSELTIVLIGGETARLLLDRLGVRHVDVQGTDGGGIVFGVACTEDGRRIRIVTRPGSFGDDDQLSALVRSIAPIPDAPSFAREGESA
jgi:4-hydroxythreonine-4-phosphate dehydrogenase